MQNLVPELRLVTQKKQAFGLIAQMEKPVQEKLRNVAAAKRVAARGKRRRSTQNAKVGLLVNSPDATLGEPEVATESSYPETTDEATFSQPEIPTDVPPPTQPRPPPSTASSSSLSDPPPSSSGSSSRKRRNRSDSISDTQTTKRDHDSTAESPTGLRKLPKRQKVVPRRYRDPTPPKSTTRPSQVQADDHMEGVEAHDDSHLHSRIKSLESDVDSLRTQLEEQHDTSQTQLREVTMRLGEEVQNHEAQNMALREELERAKQRELAVTQTMLVEKRAWEEAMRSAREKFEESLAASEAELAASRRRVEEESARAHEEARLRAGFQAKADALDLAMVPEMWKLVFALDRLAKEKGDEVVANRKLS